MFLVFIVALVTNAKPCPAQESLENMTFALACAEHGDQSYIWSLGWVLYPRAPSSQREYFPWAGDGVSSVRPPTEINQGCSCGGRAGAIISAPADLLQATGDGRGEGQAGLGLAARQGQLCTTRVQAKPCS